MASGSSLMGLATLVQNPEEMAAAYERLTGEALVLGDGVPDAGYEFVRRLLANDVVIFKSGSKLADAAGAAGQDDAMIAMTNMTYISRMVYPTFMSVAANAPHPNAAKVFIAYLLGNPEMNLDTVLAKPYLTVQGNVLDCGDVSIPLPEALAKRGGKLVAAIRPEKLLVSNTAKSGWQEVKTEILQPTGADTILQVKAGETSMTLLQSGFITLPEGTSLWVSFDTESLRFFDPDSQENLRSELG